jgi:hypothetical protein
MLTVFWAKTEAGVTAKAATTAAPVEKILLFVMYFTPSQVNMGMLNWGYYTTTLRID